MSTNHAAPAVAGTRAERWALTGVATATVFFLCFRFGAVPAGLAWDEASVGLNAHAVATTGADEYGTALPLFFRAFDDYKSPLYVYAAVVTVGLFGTGAWAVRLPSLLYALGMAGLLFLVLRRLTAHLQCATWAAVLSLLVPATYSYARHAVSEAAAYPFWLTLGILMVLRFHERPTWRRGVIAGIAVGLGCYAYSTARLLSPLLVVAVFVVWRLNRPSRRVAWSVLVGGALAGAPMATYTLLHPGTLGGRFRALSIFHDGTLLSYAKRFVTGYAQHLFSVPFLFQTGDPNLRHNIGVGMFPVWMAAFMVAGVALTWTRRREPFASFLLVILLLAPVSVALTEESLPHASRMLHLVPVMVIMAALALDHAWPWLRGQGAMSVALLSLVLLESGQFLYRYHVPYAAGSRPLFDDYRQDALFIVKEHRRHAEPVFINDNMWAYPVNVVFTLGEDAARFRRDGLDALGIHRLGSGPYPTGSLVVMDGEQPPPHNVNPQLLGAARRQGDNSVRFSVWQIPPR
jgi:4-amino-4-deoxy-L-arabinose transferase-like glycosyltransferase